MADIGLEEVSAVSGGVMNQSLTHEYLGLNSTTAISHHCSSSTGSASMTQSSSGFSINHLYAEACYWWHYC